MVSGKPNQEYTPPTLATSSFVRGTVCLSAGKECLANPCHPVMENFRRTVGEVEALFNNSDGVPAKSEYTEYC
eukprot:481078-Pleurochrysis_carterae.AAC.3